MSPIGRVRGSTLKSIRLYQRTMNWPATADDFHRDRTLIDNSLKALQWIPDRIRLSSNWNLNTVKLPNCVAEILSFKNMNYKTDSSKKRWILYLHGGAFCLMSPANYRGLLSDIGKVADACVFAPDYRLAPEQVYPSQLNDCIDGYKYMLKELNIDPSQITIAGDSAGGNLALTTFLRGCSEEKLPKPSSLVLISPWLDLTCSSPSSTFNYEHELLIDVPAIHRASWLYLNGSFNFNQFAKVADNVELTSQETAEAATKQASTTQEAIQLKAAELQYKNKLTHHLVSPACNVNLISEDNSSLSKILAEIPPTLMHVAAHEALLSEGVALAAKANLLTGSQDCAFPSETIKLASLSPHKPPKWVELLTPQFATVEGVVGPNFSSNSFSDNRNIPLSMLKTGNLGPKWDEDPAPSLARISNAEGYGRWLTMPDDKVQVHMWNEMFHVFHMMTPIEPTAKKAVEEIGHFINSHASGDGYFYKKEPSKPSKGPNSSGQNANMQEKHREATQVSLQDNKRQKNANQRKNQDIDSNIDSFIFNGKQYQLQPNWLKDISADKNLYAQLTRIAVGIGRTKYLLAKQRALLNSPIIAQDKIMIEAQISNYTGLLTALRSDFKNFLSNIQGLDQYVVKDVIESKSFSLVDPTSATERDVMYVHSKGGLFSSGSEKRYFIFSKGKLVTFKSVSAQQYVNNLTDNVKAIIKNHATWDEDVKAIAKATTGGGACTGGKSLAEELSIPKGEGAWSVSETSTPGIFLKKRTDAEASAKEREGILVDWTGTPVMKLDAKESAALIAYRKDKIKESSDGKKLPGEILLTHVDSESVILDDNRTGSYKDFEKNEKTKQPFKFRVKFIAPLAGTSAYLYTDDGDRASFWRDAIRIASVLNVPSQFSSLHSIGKRIIQKTYEYPFKAFKAVQNDRATRKEKALKFIKHLFSVGLKESIDHWKAQTDRKGAARASFDKQIDYVVKHAEERSRITVLKKQSDPLKMKKEVISKIQTDFRKLKERMMQKGIWNITPFIAHPGYRFRHGFESCIQFDVSSPKEVLELLFGPLSANILAEYARSANFSRKAAFSSDSLPACMADFFGTEDMDALGFGPITTPAYTQMDRRATAYSNYVRLNAISGIILNSARPKQSIKAILDAENLKQGLVDRMRFGGNEFPQLADTRRGCYMTILGPKVKQTRLKDYSELKITIKNPPEISDNVFPSVSGVAPENFKTILSKFRSSKSKFDVEDHFSVKGQKPTSSALSSVVLAVSQVSGLAPSAFILENVDNDGGAVNFHFRVFVHSQDQIEAVKNISSRMENINSRVATIEHCMAAAIAVKAQTNEMSHELIVETRGSIGLFTEVKSITCVSDAVLGISPCDTSSSTAHFMKVEFTLSNFHLNLTKTIVEQESRTDDEIKRRFYANQDAMMAALDPSYKPRSRHRLVDKKEGRPLDYEEQKAMAAFLEGDHDPLNTLVKTEFQLGSYGNVGLDNALHIEEYDEFKFEQAGQTAVAKNREADDKAAANAAALADEENKKIAQAKALENMNEAERALYEEKRLEERLQNALESDLGARRQGNTSGFDLFAMCRSNNNASRVSNELSLLDKMTFPVKRRFMSMKIISRPDLKLLPPGTTIRYFVTLHFLSHRWRSTEVEEDERGFINIESFTQNEERNPDSKYLTGSKLPKDRFGALHEFWIPLQSTACADLSPDYVKTVLNSSQTRVDVFRIITPPPNVDEIVPLDPREKEIYLKKKHDIAERQLNQIFSKQKAQEAMLGNMAGATAVNVHEEIAVASKLFSTDQKVTHAMEVDRDLKLRMGLDEQNGLFPRFAVEDGYIKEKAMMPVDTAPAMELPEIALPDIVCIATATCEFDKGASSEFSLAFKPVDWDEIEQKNIDFGSAKLNINLTFDKKPLGVSSYVSPESLSLGAFGVINTATQLAYSFPAICEQYTGIDSISTIVKNLVSQRIMELTNEHTGIVSNSFNKILEFFVNDDQKNAIESDENDQNISQDEVSGRVAKAIASLEIGSSDYVQLDLGFLELFKAASDKLIKIVKDKTGREADRSRKRKRTDGEGLLAEMDIGQVHDVSDIVKKLSTSNNSNVSLAEAAKLRDAALDSCNIKVADSIIGSDCSFYVTFKIGNSVVSSSPRVPLPVSLKGKMPTQVFTQNKSWDSALQPGNYSNFELNKPKKIKTPFKFDLNKPSHIKGGTVPWYISRLQELGEEEDEDPSVIGHLSEAVSQFRAKTKKKQTAEAFSDLLSYIALPEANDSIEREIPSHLCPINAFSSTVRDVAHKLIDSHTMSLSGQRLFCAVPPSIASYNSVQAGKVAIAELWGLRAPKRSYVSMMSLDQLDSVPEVDAPILLGRAMLDLSKFEFNVLSMTDEACEAIFIEETAFQEILNKHKNDSVDIFAKKLEEIARETELSADHPEAINRVKSVLSDMNAPSFYSRVIDSIRQSKNIIAKLNIRGCFRDRKYVAAASVNDSEMDIANKKFAQEDADTSIQYTNRLLPGSQALLMVERPAVYPDEKSWVRSAIPSVGPGGKKLSFNKKEFQFYRDGFHAWPLPLREPATAWEHSAAGYKQLDGRFNCGSFNPMMIGDSCTPVPHRFVLPADHNEFMAKKLPGSWNRLIGVHPLSEVMSVIHGRQIQNVGMSVEEFYEEEARLNREARRQQLRAFANNTDTRKHIPETEDKAAKVVRGAVAGETSLVSVSAAVPSQKGGKLRSESSKKTDALRRLDLYKTPNEASLSTSPGSVVSSLSHILEPIPVTILAVYPNMTVDVCLPPLFFERLCEDTKLAVQYSKNVIHAAKKNGSVAAEECIPAVTELPGYMDHYHRILRRVHVSHLRSLQHAGVPVYDAQFKNVDDSTKPLWLSQDSKVDVNGDRIPPQFDRDYSGVMRSITRAATGEKPVAGPLPWDSNPSIVAYEWQLHVHCASSRIMNETAKLINWAIRESAYRDFNSMVSHQKRQLALIKHLWEDPRVLERAGRLEVVVMECKSLRNNSAKEVFGRSLNNAIPRMFGLRDTIRKIAIESLNTFVTCRLKLRDTPLPNTAEGIERTPTIRDTNAPRFYALPYLQQTGGKTFFTNTVIPSSHLVMEFCVWESSKANDAAELTDKGRTARRLGHSVIPVERLMNPFEPFKVVWEPLKPYGCGEVHFMTRYIPHSQKMKAMAPFKNVKSCRDYLDNIITANVGGTPDRFGIPLRNLVFDQQLLSLQKRVFRLISMGEPLSVMEQAMQQAKVELEMLQSQPTTIQEHRVWHFGRILSHDAYTRCKAIHGTRQWLFFHQAWSSWVDNQRRRLALGIAREMSPLHDQSSAVVDKIVTSLGLDGEAPEVSSNHPLASVNANLVALPHECLHDVSKHGQLKQPSTLANRAAVVIDPFDSRGILSDLAIVKVALKSSSTTHANTARYVRTAHSLLFATHKWRQDGETTMIQALEDLVKASFPPVMRGRLWLDLTGAQALHACNMGVYETCLDFSRKYNSIAFLQLAEDSSALFSLDNNSTHMHRATLQRRATACKRILQALIVFSDAPDCTAYHENIEYKCLDFGENSRLSLKPHPICYSPALLHFVYHLLMTGRAGTSPFDAQIDSEELEKENSNPDTPFETMQQFDDESWEDYLERQAQRANADKLKEAEIFWIVVALTGNGRYKSYWAKPIATDKGTRGAVKADFMFMKSTDAFHPSNDPSVMQNTHSPYPAASPPGARMDAMFLDCIVATHHHMLWTKLYGLGVSVADLFYPHFSRLFAGSLPTGSLFHLWDYLFASAMDDKVYPNPRKGLINLAYAVLMNSWPDIAAAKHAGSVYAAIGNSLKSLTDSAKMMTWLVWSDDNLWSSFTFYSEFENVYMIWARKWANFYQQYEAMNIVASEITQLSNEKFRITNSKGETTVTSNLETGLTVKDVENISRLIFSNFLLSILVKNTTGGSPDEVARMSAELVKSGGDLNKLLPITPAPFADFHRQTPPELSGAFIPQKYKQFFKRTQEWFDVKLWKNYKGEDLKDYVPPPVAVFEEDAYDPSVVANPTGARRAPLSASPSQPTMGDTASYEIPSKPVCELFFPTVLDLESFFSKTLPSMIPHLRAIKRVFEHEDASHESKALSKDYAGRISIREWLTALTCLCTGTVSEKADLLYNLWKCPRPKNLRPGGKPLGRDLQEPLQGMKLLVHESAETKSSALIFKSSEDINSAVQKYPIRFEVSIPIFPATTRNVNMLMRNFVRFKRISWGPKLKLLVEEENRKYNEILRLHEEEQAQLAKAAKKNKETFRAQLPPPRPQSALPQGNDVKADMIETVPGNPYLSESEAAEIILNLSLSNDWVPKSGTILRAPSASEVGLMVENQPFELYESLKILSGLGSDSPCIAEGWIESLSEFIVDKQKNLTAPASSNDTQTFQTSCVLYLPLDSAAGKDKSKKSASKNPLRSSERHSVAVGSVDLMIDFQVNNQFADAGSNVTSLPGVLTVRPLAIHFDCLPFASSSSSPAALLTFLARVHGAVKIDVFAKETTGASKSSRLGGASAASVTEVKLSSKLKDTPKVDMKADNKKDASIAKKISTSLVPSSVVNVVEYEKQRRLLSDVSGDGIILRERCFVCPDCPSNVNVDSVGASCLLCPHAKPVISMDKPMELHKLDQCGITCRGCDFRKSSFEQRLRSFTGMHEEKSYSLKSDILDLSLKRTINLPLEMVDPDHVSSLISLRACRAITQRILSHGMHFMSNRQSALLSDITFSSPGTPPSIVSAFLVKKADEVEFIRKAEEMKKQASQQSNSTLANEKTTQPPQSYLNRDVLDVSFHLVKAWDNCIARTGSIDLTSEFNVLSQILNMDDKLAAESSRFDYLKIVFVPAGGAPPEKKNSDVDVGGDAIASMSVTLGIPLSSGGTLSAVDQWDIRDDFKSCITQPDGSQSNSVIIPFEAFRESQHPYISYAQFVDGICRSPILSETLSRLTTSMSKGIAPEEINTVVHLPRALATKNAIASNLGYVAPNAKSAVIARAAADSLNLVNVVHVAKFKQADEMIYHQLPTLVFPTTKVIHAANALDIGQIIQATHLNREDKLATMSMRRFIGSDDYRQLFKINDGPDSDTETDRKAKLVTGKLSDSDAKKMAVFGGSGQNKVNAAAHHISLHKHDTFVDFIVKCERAAYTLSYLFDENAVVNSSLRKAEILENFKSNKKSGDDEKNPLSVQSEIGKSPWHNMRLFDGSASGTLLKPHGDQDDAKFDEIPSSSNLSGSEDFCILLLYTPDVSALLARFRVNELLVSGRAQGEDIATADILDANALQCEDNWTPLNPRLPLKYYSDVLNAMPVPPRFKVAKLTNELLRTSARVRQFLASSVAGRDLISRLEFKASMMARSRAETQSDILKQSSFAGKAFKF